MAEFPISPRSKGQFSDSAEFSDLLEVIDRARRNYEFMEGSIDQRDASVGDRISVPASTKVTVTVTPNEGFVFFLEEASVDPFRTDTTYNIAADSVSTDSPVLPFGVPQVIRDKVQFEITNTDSTSHEYLVETDARESRDRATSNPQN